VISIPIVQAASLHPQKMDLPTNFIKLCDLTLALRKPFRLVRIAYENNYGRMSVFWRVRSPL